jgi:hypothetical protein
VTLPTFDGTDGTDRCYGSRHLPKATRDLTDGPARDPDRVAGNVDLTDLAAPSSAADDATDLIPGLTLALTGRRSSERRRTTEYPSTTDVSSSPSIADHLDRSDADSSSLASLRRFPSMARTQRVSATPL